MTPRAHAKPAYYGIIVLQNVRSSIMTHPFLNLDHGPGTTITKQDVFNHRFSQWIDFNFTYLNETIDDFDLFYLIQEESQSNLSHKKPFVRFVLPPKALEHLDLFETLHFDVETKILYHLNSKKPIPLPETNLKLEQLEDQEQWIQFMLAYEDIEDPVVKAQFIDLMNEQIKQKSYDIYLVKDSEQLLASVITHRKQGTLEIKEIITSEPDLVDETIYQTLTAMNRETPISILVDELDPACSSLDSLGYKAIASYTICTKYL